MWQCKVTDTRIVPVDLAALPVKAWPEQAKAVAIHLAYRIPKLKATDLFWREKFMALVYEELNTNLDDVVF